MSEESTYNPGRPPGDLFNRSECLSLATMNRYLDDNLSASELMVVEKHLVDCSLCSDALESLTEMEDRPAVDLAIEDLQNRIVKRSGTRTAVVRNIKFNFQKIASIAALLVVVVGAFAVINSIGDGNVSNELADGITVDELMNSQNRQQNAQKPLRPARGVDPFEQNYERVAESRANAPVVSTKETTKQEKILADLKKPEMKDVSSNLGFDGDGAAEAGLALKEVMDEEIVSVDDVESQDALAGSATSNFKNDDEPATMSSSGRSASKAKSIEGLIAEQDKVYNTVDQMPEFPGGQNKLQKFIRSNLKYPETAKQNGIEGTVVVSFMVDKKGKLKNARVISGVPGELNIEALRIVNSMPKWKAGKQGGNKVNVNTSVPIRFKLN